MGIGPDILDIPEILDWVSVTICPIHKGRSIQSNCMICALNEVVSYYWFYIIFRIASFTFWTIWQICFSFGQDSQTIDFVNF